MSTMRNPGRMEFTKEKKRLKCLFLTPFIPYPPVDGGRIRIYNLLKEISKNHDVEVLSLCTSAEEVKSAGEKLKEEGIGIEWVHHERSPSKSLARAVASKKSLYRTLYDSREFAIALSKKIQSNQYDVVQCEYAYMGHYRTPGTFAWVLDEHNVEFRLNETLEATKRGISGLLYKLYSKREKKLRRIEELDACRKADHVLTVSEVDQIHLIREIPELKVTVIPNGVDLNYFLRDRRVNKKSFQAVFIGKMNYQPNIDAVQWFCKNILKVVRDAIPDFVFNIVGSHPTSAVRSLGRLPGVKVIGEVEDIRPFLMESSVVVIPLRAGSGTRLKILEALSMECPVVTTRLGCEGIEVVDGEHLTIADNPRMFAENVVKILNDANLGERLGQAGRSLAESKYSWPAVASKLEGLYYCLKKNGGDKIKIRS